MSNAIGRIAVGVGSATVAVVGGPPAALGSATVIVAAAAGIAVVLIGVGICRAFSND